MNVLLTSVGRRAYMVKYFKAAVGPKGEVHVCNSDDKSIAFKYADKKIVSPLIYDKNYIPFLIQYCKNNKIDIIISLFDIDLLMLAKHKKEFEDNGTKVIVSDPSIIEMCNDKWKTFCYLRDNGFETPRTYLNIEDVLVQIKSGSLSFPIVVKPRFGCGSISISIAYDEEELRCLTKRAIREIESSYLKYESDAKVEKVIYQELLSGQEYGADIINDLEGITQNVIVRRKIAMRSGETDIAELVDCPVIKNVLLNLGKKTRHLANMDCDIFLINNVPYILELNARFGGGYPFSHMGGCDLPKAIINWIEGKAVAHSLIDAKTGKIGYKEICITEV